MMPTSQELANLAFDSYSDYTTGGKAEVFGKTYEVIEFYDNPETGYQGTIYKDKDTQEIIAAHRGTEFDKGKDKAVKDGTSDLLMAAWRVNNQADEAIFLTQRAIQAAGGDKSRVTVTGHSLGGALTQITSHHFGLHGETINAYGAATLNRRIPEGGDLVINRVMATDIVSAASKHFGSVVTYATQKEIDGLQNAGYDNNRSFFDARSMVVGAATGAAMHSAHYFAPVDGDGKPDISILQQPQALQNAQQYSAMIEKYRSDVQETRGNLTAIVKNFNNLEMLRPTLEPGEPANQPYRGSYEFNDKGDYKNYDVDPGMMGASPSVRRRQPDAAKSTTTEHTTSNIISDTVNTIKNLPGRDEAMRQQMHRLYPNDPQYNTPTKTNTDIPSEYRDDYQPSSDATKALTSLIPQYARSHNPEDTAVAVAATNSTAPKFQAAYDKILTEIRDDPDVMNYLAKNGMDNPQSLSSIAAHAANQSYANGAHPILGVVMMDDGQLTVAYQNSGKIYSDDYTINMAQAAQIEPKISEQTATLALEQHHQDFAAQIAQYQIPGGVTHGMGLGMPSGSSGGDGGSV
jgi:hypothetical protein